VNNYAAKPHNNQNTFRITGHGAEARLIPGRNPEISGKQGLENGTENSAGKMGKTSQKRPPVKGHLISPCYNAGEHFIARKARARSQEL
jgi:hypothetical protein